ncbi:MAG TPA: hypothetical protein VK886_04235 [Vicinamibacterales bacterium]|nr:hypothetical protein [Vicinamibacterales bacterium]
MARQASGSPVAVPAPVAPTREALRVEAPRREPPTATERPEAERNASDRTASVLPASFTVASILWSPDRQLAFIGGRIVAVGDIVDGARVVEIRQDSVLVRDAQGRLRRAVLAGPLDPGS